MKPQQPSEHYIISSSPHAHSGASVPVIMRDVVIALMPALVVSLYYFCWARTECPSLLARLNPLILIGTCLATCLATEWLCRKLMKRENSLGDWSAVVTALLLAFNLPPDLPPWMAMIGSAFAIIIAKQVFGGLGYNPFNPALAARAFMLISFTGAMTTWSSAPVMMLLSTDATTTATPLALAKRALTHPGVAEAWSDPTVLSSFFIGNVNGCIGETSALALLLGAGYLLWRKVITWHIPVAYIATVFIYALVLNLASPTTSIPAMAHVLSGGLILGACFMATDMVTSPVTKKGMLIFGVGCGIITMLIRTAKTGAYPEGVSFAILIMNALTPLINRMSRPKPFGTTKK